MLADTVSHMLTDIDASDLRLRLDFKWVALDNLQHLSIQCDEFYSSQSILDVLTIKQWSLQTLSRVILPPPDHLPCYVYELAKRRPDVCLKLARRFCCLTTSWYLICGSQVKAI
ncbi:hypothetical protein ABBQ32_007418 [Trebouxia sp. C0010 RCD-2024]